MRREANRVLKQKGLKNYSCFIIGVLSSLISFFFFCCIQFISPCLEHTNGFVRDGAIKLTLDLYRLVRDAAEIIYMWYGNEPIY